MAWKKEGKLKNEIQGVELDLLVSGYPSATVALRVRWRGRARGVSAFGRERTYQTFC
jgi:hypothetical protein